MTGERKNRRVAMIYELRVYTTVDGRLADLLARFEQHTIGLWARHGIKQAGFWTTIVGPSAQQLTYMLVWTSLDDRQEIWRAFLADPDWLAVVAETERDGPLIVNVQNSFLEPTTFSSVT
jgi:hypothetical protein